MPNMNELKNGYERRQITIMFVDIVKSSEILKKFDVEEAEVILDEIITKQVEICRSHQGIVNQVMGDGLMCLFGVETAYEGHALQALLVADEMLKSIKSLQRKFKKGLLGIRIGINTGEVIFKPSGNESFRAKYKVIGEAVHIADRVIKLAKPDQALITESSKILAERFYRFDKVQNLQWKKDKEVIQLYKKSAKHQNPCVVKPSEKPGILIRNIDAKNILEHMYGSSNKASLKISWIQSGAGFGKTYISEYIANSAQSFKNVIRVNFYPHSVSGDQSRFEYDLLSKIIPADKRSLRQTIQNSQLLNLLGDADLLYDCLCEMLRIKNLAKNQWQELQKESRAKIQNLVLSKLFSEFCSAGKTLLLFEDLHWARENEFQYIESLIRAIKGSDRAQLLFTSRKESDFDLCPAENDIKTFRLEPLSQMQSLQLLQTVNNGIKMSKKIAKKICHLTKGNPYFIKEYVLWFQQKKKLELSDNSILNQLDQNVPGKVAGILYAKLEHLDQKTIHIIKLASIQGIEIDLDMLVSMTSLARKEVIECLRNLESADVIVRSRYFPIPVWTFTHELLQKAIYASLPKTSRIKMHLDVVNKLRFSKRTRNRNNVHQLMSFHAGFTDNIALKYICAKLAARETNKLSMHIASIGYLNEAKNLLFKIKGDIHRDRHLGKLQFQALESLFITSQYAEAKKTLDSLLQRKGFLKELGLLKKTLSFQGLYFWIKGNIPQAEKITLGILKLDDPASDRGAYFRENTRLTHIYLDLGQYQKSIICAKRVLDKLKKENYHLKYGLLGEVGPIILSDLALAYAESHDQVQSNIYFIQAQEALEKSKDYFTRVCTSLYLAHSLIISNKYQEASGFLKSALNHADLAQSDLLRPYILSAYGLVLAKLGHSEAGIRYCRQSLDIAAQGKLLLRISQFNLWHAEALMTGGQFHLAIQCLRKALKSAESSGERARLINAHLLMAECYRKISLKNKKYQSRYNNFRQRSLMLARRDKTYSVTKIFA
jgi:class 3 adenylate cyclase/tetratricopeptide (TPR) repeat protein